MNFWGVVRRFHRGFFCGRRCRDALATFQNDQFPAILPSTWSDGPPIWEMSDIVQTVFRRGIGRLVLGAWYWALALKERRYANRRGNNACRRGPCDLPCGRKADRPGAFTCCRLAHAGARHCPACCVRALRRIGDGGDCTPVGLRSDPFVGVLRALHSGARSRA